MKKKWLYTFFCIFIAIPAFCQTSSMVEKHIFIPNESQGADKQSEKKADSNMDSSDFQLIGIIVTSKGKKAIFTQKDTGIKSTSRVVFQEGDEVKNMSIIQSIGTNHVILSKNGVLSRMNLFGGIKNRPTPPTIASSDVEKKNETGAGNTNMGSGLEKKIVSPENSSPFGGGKLGENPNRNKNPFETRGSEPGVGHPDKSESDGINSPSQIFKKLTEQNMIRQNTNTESGRNHLLEVLNGSKQD